VGDATLRSGWSVGRRDIGAFVYEKVTGKGGA